MFKEIRSDVFIQKQGKETKQFHGVSGPLCITNAKLNSYILNSAKCSVIIRSLPQAVYTQDHASPKSHDEV